MQSYIPTQLQSRDSNTEQLFQTDISVHKPMQCMLGAFYVCNPMIMNYKGIHYNLKIKTAMTKIPQIKNNPQNAFRAKLTESTVRDYFSIIRHAVFRFRHQEESDQQTAASSLRKQLK